ncbi:DUF4376 domain-containing protein [Hoeflea poritis]|uniref:DUF4376 domain-containing protein n=1 Tax=Hoeflea poritis TaxID=2993659 RepID=A0ABT4VMQ2_9HYPH|nr:DUF4376 domain-containing protein [Hoeflea poritis]MDA4845954.1 DUF4376 domain-containing protein [Hoeflea poritis]
MPDVLVYKDPETDVLRVVRPAPDYDGTWKDLAEQVLPEGVTAYKVVPSENLPKDRRNRDHWKASFSQTKANFTVSEDAPSDVRQQRVNVERERRKTMPVTVSLSTGKTFPVDMDKGGRANIADLCLFAVVKKSGGDSSPFKFTDANNVDHALTNDEMIEVGVQSAQQITTIHEKARALKKMETVPDDPADDALWD